jgi:hypothetical protein
MISYHQQPVPPLLTMGAWPINQPRASTLHASTLREGGWAHPRLHDSTAPKENVRPTTSLWAFSLKKSMM